MVLCEHQCFSFHCKFKLIVITFEICLYMEINFNSPHEPCRSHDFNNHYEEISQATSIDLFIWSSKWILRFIFCYLNWPHWRLWLCLEKKIVIWEITYGWNFQFYDLNLKVIRNFWSQLFYYYYVSIAYFDVIWTKQIIAN